MRRTMHLMAFSSIFVGFAIFSLYSGYRNPGRTYFRLPQPAAEPSDDQADDPARPAGPAPTYGEIGILQELNVEFLPNYKNPCWYEVIEEAERANYYAAVVKQPSRLRYVTEKNTGTVLRCLPYFILAGMPKCGTTDIFQRINAHPDVVQPAIKGPHWWTRRRYGMPYALLPVSFIDYLDLFNLPAHEIEEQWDLRDNHQYHAKITGDGSTSTLWDSARTMTFLTEVFNDTDLVEVMSRFIKTRNGFIRKEHCDKTKKTDPVTMCCSDNIEINQMSNHVEKITYSQNFSIQPGAILPVKVADIIHAVNPDTRIIVSVREPASRLYSSYLYFSQGDVSPETFDESVRRSVEMWENCTTEYSPRICAYNKTLHEAMSVRLYNGLYSIYLCDWLKVFPRNQILVVRMEDYRQDMISTLKTIYNHLDLRALTELEETVVKTAKIQNKSRKKHKVGKMLNSTALFLKDFYEQYNEQLADMLGDKTFLWQDSYSLW